MKEKKESAILQAIGVVMLVVVLYMISRLLGLDSKPIVVKSEMAVLMIVIAAAYIWQKRTQNAESTIKMIMIGGMIMRIGYMIYTDCNVRAHDLWEIDVNSTGHAGYLLRLIENHRLPESNYLQLYQQPFYYLISSCFSIFINFILRCKEPYYLVDAAKTVSCAASCISLLVCRKLFEECGLKAEEIKNAMLLTAFLPVFYLTGGRVGPNALAAMFMLLAFLYTMRWIKQPDWKNTIILAVVYGLGVMTKISSGVIAIMTALTFIKKLFCRSGSKEKAVLMLKYVVFGMISLPLGLWYSVRNYILFHQSLNYVLPQGKSSTLYTGMHSVAERLFGIDFANLIYSPYTNVFEDYNAPVYYVKSSLFGEFTYQVPGFIPVLLLLCAVLLSAAVFAAIVWQIVKNRADKAGNLVAMMFLLFYGNMLWFYLQYPHGCSMDFRYMTFIVAPAAILLSKYMAAHPKSQRGLNYVLWGEAICSCIMYCMI